MNKVFKCLILCGILIGSIAQTAYAITIVEIKQFVNGLPLEDFSNADTDLKTSIQKELDAISDALTMADSETDAGLKATLKQDAIDNLNVLKNKNSGCINNGTPEINASIITLIF